MIIQGDELIQFILKKESYLLKELQNAPKVSIILPTLNEAQSIRKVISEINRLPLFQKEILIVDGCSKDATIDFARKMGVNIIIEHIKGYGNAIQKGINIARGQIIVIMDSDYTYPGSSIPQLITPLIKNEADLILGNRLEYYSLSSMKISHLFGNLILTTVFNLLFHSKIRDTQTGFRAFRKTFFEKLNVESKGIFLPTEILVKALRLHFKIKEIPIVYRPRIGKSKLNPILDGFIILIKIILTRLSFSKYKKMRSPYEF
ncbi:MAG: glycosyltransferase family 2 protein [Candidatus Helarchaeota archaeon]|nr:glycosyltransferase family 2 protein [Candidatus Helarchaeota archaeon]